jgi:hypothetical protein
MPCNLTVPFPAIERRVSGRIKIMKNNARAPRMSRNAKMERKPRNCVRRPPTMGPRIDSAFALCHHQHRYDRHASVTVPPPKTPIRPPRSAGVVMSPIIPAPVITQSACDTLVNMTADL